MRHSSQILHCVNLTNKCNHTTIKTFSSILSLLLKTSSTKRTWSWLFAALHLFHSQKCSLTLQCLNIFFYERCSIVILYKLNPQLLFFNLTSFHLTFIYKKYFSGISAVFFFFWYSLDFKTYVLMSCLELKIYSHLINVKNELNDWWTGVL